jgi:hypothetical protein
MDVDTGQFRALTDQVAALSARVEELTAVAGTARAIGERAERFRRAFAEESAWRGRPGEMARRRRHLRLVGGGRS